MVKDSYKEGKSKVMNRLKKSHEQLKRRQKLGQGQIDKRAMNS